MSVIGNSLVGYSPQRACVSVHVVNTFLFSLGIKGNFCILGVPNLLVGRAYHVKTVGCFLEVINMRLFNQTLSIYCKIYLKFCYQQLVNFKLTFHITIEFAILLQSFRLFSCCSLQKRQT